MLMDYLGKMEMRFEAIDERFLDLEQKIDEKIRQSEERMKRHFDVVAEHQMHEFKGAFADKLARHDDQIAYLRKHAVLRPA